MDMSLATPQTLRRPWRDLFRFKLRTLLFVMTILCLWFGLIVSRAKRQEQAVAAIEDLQADVYYDTKTILPIPQWFRALLGRHYFDEVIQVSLNKHWGENRERSFIEADYALSQLDGLKNLQLNGWPMSTEGWRAIARIESLEELNCYGMEVSVAGAAELAQSKKLSKLRLRDVIISNQALNQLAQLPSLKSLSFSSFDGGSNDPTDNYKLLDDAAETIAKFPHLREVYLLQTFITDDGVAALSSIKNLESLNVSSPMISSESLEHIAKLQNLEFLGTWCWKLRGKDLSILRTLPKFKSLSLIAVPLTDDDLPFVAQLTNLERLQLDSNAISDAGLAHLHALTNLKRLDVQYTGIDRNGNAIQELRQALPNCIVIGPKPPERFPGWQVSGSP